MWIGQCGIPLKAFPTAGTAAQNKQNTFLGIDTNPQTSSSASLQ